jgi:hypothetical protein
MSKKQVTSENVFDQPHYTDILRLLVEYQNEDGLTFEQLNHILVKKYNIDVLGGYRPAKALIKAGMVTPNSITTKNNLSKFLRTLLKIKIIKKDRRNDRKKYKYLISEEFQTTLIKIINKECLDEYPTDQIVMTSQKDSKSSFVIYGISQKTWEEFSPEEIKKIDEHMTEIEDHIRSIEMLKIKKVFEKLISDGSIRDVSQLITPTLGISLSRIIKPSYFMDKGLDLSTFTKIKKSEKELFDFKRFSREFDNLEIKFKKVKGSRVLEIKSIPLKQIFHDVQLNKNRRIRQT